MKFYLIFILLITGSIVVSASRPAECLESPAVAGRCDAIVTRFSYYPKKRKCQRFNYGGCNGNRNNFRTLNLCEERCSPRSHTGFRQK